MCGYTGEFIHVGVLFFYIFLAYKINRSIEYFYLSFNIYLSFRIIRAKIMDSILKYLKKINRVSFKFLGFFTFE